MAQIENLNSFNAWDYHCPPPSNPQGYRDFDYRIIWGNDGSLTIQRENLIGIKFSANCWNTRDGWMQMSAERMLSNPTSQSHTFSGVFLFTLFGRNQTELYWGARYQINSKLEVLHSNGEIIEIITTKVEGCLKKFDLHYDPSVYPNCTP